MSHRVDLFQEAMDECNSLITRYPNVPSLKSIYLQLEYLLALASGGRDNSRLKDIIIGPLTAREIEPLSRKAAELFYQVAAEARSMAGRAPGA